MNATSSNVNTIPERLRVVLTLAHVLERLDRTGGVVGADQYRSVVEHLSTELSRLDAEPALQAILDAHPSTAELYENIHYQHAGLCRSPLDTSLAAELQARQVMVRAARRDDGRGRGTGVSLGQGTRT